MLTFVLSATAAAVVDGIVRGEDASLLFSYISSGGSLCSCCNLLTIVKAVFFVKDPTLHRLFANP
jgi:hypothetical protein